MTPDAALPTADQYTILTACTGNICRSPAAERLLVAGFGPGSGIRVESAGTGALVGHPIDPPMARLVEAHGGDVGGFRARALTERVVSGADLVLALTREHRGAVVELRPAAVRRTFTLRELARLVEPIEEAEIVAAAGTDAGPAARLRALTQLAVRRRVQVEAELDDIPDPYRQPTSVYLKAIELIAPAVDTIVRRATGR